MDPLFFNPDLNTQIDIDVPPVLIKKSSSEININPAAPEKYEGGYFFRYLNPQRNSRLKTFLPKRDMWEVKWKAEINSSFYPWYILISGSRLILQNESGWQLFDDSGKIISEGLKGEGNISLNEKRDEFYLNDPSGFIAVHDINSGKRKFLIYPEFGKGFERAVIAFEKDTLLVAGFELQGMTHKGTIKPPDYTILERIYLSSKEDIDDDGVLNSVNQVNKLFCKAMPKLLAYNNGEIILAVKDNIYFIDGQLNIIKHFEGDFTPIEISVDEETRIHTLVKDTNEEDYELWVVDKEGNLLIQEKLEIETEKFYPPLITYDHTIFIINGNRIIELDNTGNVVSDEFTKGDFTRAVCLPDNSILISEGNIISSMKKGIRKLIYQFDDDLFTPPLLSGDGEIFAATKKYLYCIVPK